MISTHEYTAHIIDPPGNPALNISGGTITLDTSSAPHVTATIEIAIPEASTLDALDPRIAPRIHVEAAAEYEGRSVTRSFNLGLRERRISHLYGRVTLDLASDEALLLDYSPLVDDDAPLYLSSSIRDVVDYVLDTAIPGAQLETSPDNDVDVTATWEVRNGVIDPIPADTGALHFGGGATANASSLEVATDGGWESNTSRLRWVAPSSTPSVVRVHQEESARPGDQFTFYAHLRSGSASTTGAVRLVGVDKNRDPLQTFESTPVPLPTDPDEYEQATLTARFDHPDTREVLAYLVAYPSGSGQAFAAGGFLYTEGSIVVPWFYGGMSDDARYSYTWDSVTNASGSIRTPFIERSPDAYIWKAGESALDFVLPIVQAAGLRIVCDEQQEWTLRSTDHLAEGALNIRYGVNLIDATDVISRMDETWGDAAVTIYEWTDINGVDHRRIDAYTTASPHTRPMVFEKSTPYPGPGFSQYVVQRSQGRGRAVDVTAVADWAAVAEQSCAFVVPGAPTQVGKTERVVFDLSRDEMTATARTTDTPIGAWLLGTPDETWLEAPDDETWLEAG